MNFLKVETDEHIKRVVQLAEEIWNEHYPGIITQEQIDYMLNHYQSALSIRQQLNGGTLYYLSCLEDTGVGYFSIIPDRSRQQLHLSKFYLLKKVRSRGYAKAMFHFILSYMQQEQLDKINLTVNKHNVIAIAAYEKLGFIKTDSLIMDIGNGFVMDDYKMECSIMNSY